MKMYKIQNNCNFCFFFLFFFLTITSCCQLLLSPPLPDEPEGRAKEQIHGRVCVCVCVSVCVHSCLNDMASTQVEIDLAANGGQGELRQVGNPFAPRTRTEERGQAKRFSFLARLRRNPYLPADVPLPAFACGRPTSKPNLYEGYRLITEHEMHQLKSGIYLSSSSGKVPVPCQLFLHFPTCPPDASSASVQFQLYKKLLDSFFPHLDDLGSIHSRQS